MWSGCNATLRVGPLSAGTHTLRVRTTDDAGATFGAVTSFSWAIVAASDSQLSFSYLVDGPHSLPVAAVDPLGHVEQSPRTYSWTVDTVPPVTSAVLTSAAYTQAHNATVAVACLGEAQPDACVFCWTVTVAGVVLQRDVCSGNGTSTVTVTGGPDGATTALVAAIDGAGNRDSRPVNVTWVVDTTPPVTTTLQIVSATVLVPAIGTYAVNTTSVLLRVGASEAASAYRVTVTRQGDSTVGGGVDVTVVDAHTLSVPMSLQVSP